MLFLKCGISTVEIIEIYCKQLNDENTETIIENMLNRTTLQVHPILYSYMYKGTFSVKMYQ